jgi:hypothetical protein
MLHHLTMSLLKKIFLDRFLFFLFSGHNSYFVFACIAFEAQSTQLYKNIMFMRIFFTKFIAMQFASLTFSNLFNQQSIDLRLVSLIFIRELSFNANFVSRYIN